MNSDAELLRRYATEGVEEAFDELVKRHVDLVYSAAVRCLNGDTHRAEDVTQEVFAEMARQSRKLARHSALVGWLYVTTRRMSLRVVRVELRRAAREKEAIQMSDIATDAALGDEWKRLSQELDGAMERLGSTDRLAILLRFFQRKNFNAVGAALGLRENAARMRVDRALEKLRSELVRKGVKSTTTALGAALLANSVLAAPPLFVSSVATKSLAKAAALSGVGIMEWIAATKSQLAAAGAVVIAAVVAFVAVQRQSPLISASPEQLAAVQQPANQPTLAARETNASNALELPKISAAGEAVEPITVQAKAIEISPEIEKEVLAMIEDWETLPSIFDDAEIYTKQLRRLKEIGPAATPLLSAALERTSRDAPLRLIPFALRVIGDPHAIPALIRVIPKTLRPPGSDCGVGVKDFEVMRFMHSNHVSAVEGYPSERSNFDMARPLREVAASLHKLTGARLNEEEIFMTFLQGGEAQRTVQRRAFYDVAVNWANWWKSNAERFAKDFAPTDLELAIARPAVFEAARSDQFLTGPNVKVTDGSGGNVLSPVEQGNNCAMQLALGRRINLPASYLGKGANPTAEQLLNWAQGADADLLGGYFSSGNSGKSFYCMQGVGLRAWEVSNDSWTNVAKLIERGEFPKLGREAGDWLMHFDEEQERYLPEKKATFVFITRDGLQGMLRTTAQVTKDERRVGGFLRVHDESGEEQRASYGFENGIQFDYKFFYVETEELKQEAIARAGRSSATDAARKERKMARLFAAHPKISGSVLLPNGEAAARAQVLLAVPGEGAVLEQKGFNNTGQTTMVETGPDGRFELPHVPTARRIFVWHRDGFAEEELEPGEESVSIRLGHWGEIEGTVMRQGKPAAHETVALFSGGFEPGTALAVSLRTETDNLGHFTFTNLPPGEIQIARLVKNRFYEGQMVKVVAGHATAVRFGASGRTIKGRFRTSDGSEAEWSKNPGFYFNPKNEEQAKGPSGQKTVRIPVYVSADGEFRIEDVPAGNYDFRGDLREGAGEDGWEFGKTLGRFKREVTVPDGKGELDIGDIVLEMLANP